MSKDLDTEPEDKRTPIERATHVRDNLQMISELLGDWYDHLGTCNFSTTTTTIRLKHKKKLDNISHINTHGHLYAVEILPDIVDTSAKVIDELLEELKREGVDVLRRLLEAQSYKVKLNFSGEQVTFATGEYEFATLYDESLEFTPELLENPLNFAVLAFCASNYVRKSREEGL